MMNPQDICDSALQAAIRKRPQSACVPGSVAGRVEEIYQTVQVRAEGLSERTSYLVPLHEDVGNIVARAQHTGG